MGRRRTISDEEQPMVAAEAWPEPDDEVRTPRTSAPHRPWVATGGWRRAVVGFMVGVVAGRLVLIWIDRESSARDG